MKKSSLTIRYLVCLFLAFALFPALVFASDSDSDYISYDLHRYALVIGNDKYEEGALGNPVNDAKLMASKLSEAGFDVYLYQNLSKTGMDDAVSSFVKVVNNDKSATAVVYYAGHGVEVEGVNYLIPVNNGKIGSEADVKIYAYSLDNILNLLDAKEQIIILDACRNNPFKMSGDRATGVKGGLGALKDAKRGVTMSYLFAAQSGQTAKDGDGGNSVFTAILAEEIEKGNVPISQLFNNVAARVKSMTNDEQVPLSSTTGSDFIFQSEELSKAVLAKWEEQLKKAEADLKKLEAGGSNNDAAALADSQAKVALAQAEKEASERRAAQLKADEEKAKLEAEEAAQRSSELQAQIEAMRIASENAALLARQAEIEQFDIRRSINEIENNKLSWASMKGNEDELIKAKRAELEAALVVTMREIDTAPYYKGELDSSGNPTEMALKVREMHKENERQTMEAQYAEYVASISGSSSDQRAELLKLIKSEIEVIEKKTFVASSVLGSLNVHLDQYDGEQGGWNLHVSTSLRGYNGVVFSREFFLPYETVTGLELMKEFTDFSQYAQYQEFLEQVEMFDALFRSEVPVIQVEMTYMVDIDGGLSYCFIPMSFEVKRADNNRIVLSLTQDEMASFWGNEFILSGNGIDIRTDEEKQADMLDVSQYSVVLFPGREIPSTMLLKGTMVSGLLVNEWYLKNSSYAVLPEGDASTDSSKRLYGWTVSGSGKLGSNSSVPYLVGDVIQWREGDKLPTMLYCNKSEVEFTRYAIVSTSNGDLAANPGEKIYLDIVFQNTGSATLKNACLTLSTKTSGIELSDSKRNWISLDANRYLNSSSSDNYTSKASTSYYYGVSIGKNYNPDNPVVIDWVMEGDDHPAWSGSFEIPVSYIDSDVSLEGMKIISTSNGDDVVEQGETVYFDLAFLNYGTSKIMHPQLELSVSGSGVTIEKSKNSWWSLDAGDYLNCYSTDLEKIGYYNGQYYSEYAYCIKISDYYDTSKPITIKWKMTGDSHPQWEGSFDINVNEKTSQQTAKSIVNNSKDLELQGYRINQTDNGDRIANPGETMYFDVCFKNTGSSDMLNPKLTLSTKTSGVQITKGTNSWTRFQKGKYHLYYDGYYYDEARYATDTSQNYVLKIASNYDVTKPIEISWTMTCDGKSGMTGTFTIPVKYVEGDVELQGYRINQTDNGDRTANPGETVYFDVCFKNTGSSDLLSPKLTLSTKTSGVQITQGTHGWSRFQGGKYHLFYDGYYYDEARYATDTSQNYVLKIASSYDVTNPIEIAWTITCSGKPPITGTFTIPVKYTEGEVELQGYRISQTDNGDKTANPGETVYFDVCFKNIGGSDMLNPKLTLSTKTSGVQITQGTNSWSRFQSGKYHLYYDGYYYDEARYATDTSQNYVLKIASNYDVTKPIEISWTLTCDGRPPMTGTFTMPVKYVEGDVELQGYRINQTDNGDRTANPGETVYFDVCFKNIGGSDMLNPKLTLSTKTSGVQITKGTNSWGRFQSGKYHLYYDGYYYDEARYATDTSQNYVLKIASNYDVTKPIEISWTMTCDGIPPMTGTFTMPVQKK